MKLRTFPIPSPNIVRRLKSDPMNSPASEMATVTVNDEASIDPRKVRDELQPTFSERSTPTDQGLSFRRSPQLMIP